MMAPPTPTTTPMIVFRVSAVMPFCAPPFPLFARPAVCVEVVWLVKVVDCPSLSVVVMIVVDVTVERLSVVAEVVGGAEVDGGGVLVAD